MSERITSATTAGASTGRGSEKEASDLRLLRCMGPTGRHTDSSARAVLWNDHGESSCGAHQAWLARSLFRERRAA